MAIQTGADPAHAAMAFAWGVQRVTGNGGWVDVIWTFATGAAGVTLALWPFDGQATPRAWLVGALAGLFE